MIAKSEHPKHTKAITKNYNILFILIITNFLYSYMNLPNAMYKWQPYIIHCSVLHVPSHFVSFFAFGNGVPKGLKKAANLFMNDLRKFRKFIISSISRFGNIKEVWYKDWKMSLYKPGQVRACFCWIIEKSQIIQLNISFHDDNFCVDFFSRMQILSYLV